jgi:hypothetical protein
MFLYSTVSTLKPGRGERDGCQTKEGGTRGKRGTGLTNGGDGGDDFAEFQLV